MGAISRKKKGSKTMAKSVTKSSKTPTNRGSIISPMMPRHFSAKEREEIRKKEFSILKGETK